MIEIRPIEHSEAGAFLRVLCTVFSLDFDRASTVFFTEPMFDLRRKWGLFESGRMVSVLTTTPLQFGWGNAIGIAGVATIAEARGRGLAGQLMQRVLDVAGLNNEGAAVLFAQNTPLYERIGFEITDRVVRGIIRREDPPSGPEEVSSARVRQIYQEWADASPARLQRDARRWRYWDWGYRLAEGAPGGYLSFEGSLVREAIITPNLAAWNVPAESEWLGLQSMTEEIGVPLVSHQLELNLMTIGFPHRPEMFMTDQF
jgi:GNAT superfamily N-acetyltransferase